MTIADRSSVRPLRSDRRMMDSRTLRLVLGGLKSYFPTLHAGTEGCASAVPPERTATPCGCGISRSSRRRCRRSGPRVGRGARTGRLARRRLRGAAERRGAVRRARSRRRAPTPQHDVQVLDELVSTVRAPRADPRRAHLPEPAAEAAGRTTSRTGCSPTTGRGTSASITSAWSRSAPRCSTGRTCCTTTCRSATWRRGARARSTGSRWISSSRRRRCRTWRTTPTGASSPARSRRCRAGCGRAESCRTRSTSAFPSAPSGTITGTTPTPRGACCAATGRRSRIAFRSPSISQLCDEYDFQVVSVKRVEQAGTPAREGGAALPRSARGGLRHLVGAHRRGDGASTSLRHRSGGRVAIRHSH